MPSPRCIRASPATATTSTIDLIFDIDQGPRVYIEQDQHRRQHAHAGQGDPPRIPAGRRRRLQPRAGRPFAHPHPRRWASSRMSTSRTRRAAQPDRTDLTVTVTEQSTGQLSLGAGYSSTSSARRRVQLYRAAICSAAASICGLSFGLPDQPSNSSSASPSPISSTARWRPASISTRSQTNYEQATYSSDTTGCRLRLGFPISEYSIGRPALHLPDRRRSTPSPARRWKSSWPPAATYGSIFGYTYGYNKLDDLRKPTTGMAFSLQPGFRRLRRQSAHISRPRRSSPSTGPPLTVR